jgi:transcriptional regulator with XRE-family HTH domain
MEKTQLVEIGQRLRKRRTELGLTREKMAELADIGTGYYGQLEVGTSQMSNFPVPCIFPWITSSLVQKMLPAMLLQS